MLLSLLYVVVVVHFSVESLFSLPVLDKVFVGPSRCELIIRVKNAVFAISVSYTHLTLPTNREV